MNVFIQFLFKLLFLNICIASKEYYMILDHKYNCFWSSLRKVSQIKYDLISTISGTKLLSNIQLYTELMPPSL